MLAELREAARRASFRAAQAPRVHGGPNEGDVNLTPTANKRVDISTFPKRQDDRDVNANGNKMIDASAFANAKWREEGERALDLAMQKLRLRDPDEARNWFEKVKSHMYACIYLCTYGGRKGREPSIWPCRS